MSVLKFVEGYRASGRVVLPIPAGTKRAILPGWSDPDRHDFLIGDLDNVAWRLDGIGDIDLDCLEAIILARFFLPPTGARSGRPAVREPGHWFYLSAGLTYEKFDEPGGGTLLEIRTGAGHYTVVPPSKMPAARGFPEELAVWFDDGPPSEQDPAFLRRRCAMLAAAALLSRSLGINGFGHEARLEVAGFLLRLGLSEEEAILLGEAISGLTQNSEVSDVAVTVRSTATRLAGDGRAVKGGPALAKRLGELGKAKIAAISKWLGSRRVNDIEFAPGGPPLTETGDAEKFAELNASSVRHDWRRGRWLLFGGHTWSMQTDGEIDRLALETVRARQLEAASDPNDDSRRARLKWALGGESRARRANLADLARSVRPLADAGDSWDADPWLLGCPNGIVDLRTGELRPGTPEDRVTMRTRAEFDPAAEAPNWDRAIEQIFGGDPELIAYFDRFVGYSITGDCREEALAICWGEGANGKGTLMNAIGWALGDYADDLPFSTFEMGARGGIPNDVAKIDGRRFVTSSETGEAQRLNEARVKALTGRDPITARFLHKEFFTFQPVAKFWLATNHKPDVRDDSAGFWRRIHLIPFEQSFVGREDRGLKDRLRNELPGILARAVRGVALWLERGLDPPASVTGASARWREESDILAPFIDDELVIAEGARAQASVLHATYLRWCGRRGIKDAMGQKAFGTRMRKLFAVEEKSRGGVWYLGVGIRDNEHGETM